MLSPHSLHIIYYIHYCVCCVNPFISIFFLFFCCINPISSQLLTPHFVFLLSFLPFWVLPPQKRVHSKAGIFLFFWPRMIVFHLLYVNFCFWFWEFLTHFFTFWIRVFLFRPQQTTCDQGPFFLILPIFFILKISLKLCNWVAEISRIIREISLTGQLFLLVLQFLSSNAFRVLIVNQTPVCL